MILPSSTKFSAQLVSLAVTFSAIEVIRSASTCNTWRYKFRPLANGSHLVQPEAVANFSQLQRRTFRTKLGGVECSSACGRMYECRAFSFCPDFVQCSLQQQQKQRQLFDACAVGDCILYSNSGPPFPSPACQQPVMRKFVSRYESCVERWVNGRRFCLIQQRISGNVSFRRPWTDYVSGFGDANNFWIGLNTIRDLLPSTVRFEFTKFNGSVYHCEYDSFSVGDETTKYTMDYSRYALERSNIATDSLDERSRGMKFSTTDQDNDLFSASCSNDWAGGAGWWFRGCFRANPNGEYSDTEVLQQSKYMAWYHIDGEFVSLRQTRIMVQVDG